MLVKIRVEVKGWGWGLRENLETEAENGKSLKCLEGEMGKSRGRRKRV